MHGVYFIAVLADDRTGSDVLHGKITVQAGPCRRGPVDFSHRQGKLQTAA